MSNAVQEQQRILEKAGQGSMDNTAYDTAWIARLGEIDRELANNALNWICENQLSDGSWGAKGIMYYHDRVVSTLSAMIALTHRGQRAQDKIQIEKGLLALERITSGATTGLSADPNGATVGFEMIIPTLVIEAENLGIIKQQGNRILGRMRLLREKKMQKLAGLQINRHYTPAFSAEMAGDDGKTILDANNLQESNGSVANSPSASAYFAQKIKKGDEKALSYLRIAVRGRKGGAPFASPFTVFERAWVIWNLSLTPSFFSNVEMQRSVAPHLEFLSHAWKPGQGTGFSDEYTPCDSDDSSMTYDVLARAGILLDTKTIFNYEDELFFRCYPLEANPSIGANIHILGALRQAGFEKDHPAIKKIVNFLISSCQPEGYWIDKWHVSPYYITSHVVITCKDLEKDLCLKAVNWILRTQKEDGSWGYFGFSTAEETAYSLQALNIWNQSGHHVDHHIIRKANHWLELHNAPPYPALWISKALYCPQLVVEAVIQSALALSEESS